MKKIKSFVFLIISIVLLFSFLLVLKMAKPVVYKRMLSLILPVQIDYQTAISITDYRKEMKLVTAKRYMDFIKVMDGKDGNLIQISTYEVKAGIDFSEGENAKVKILSDESGKSSRSITIRNLNTSNDTIMNYTKPVETAYRQKALEYAVQNKILEKAKKQAEESLSKLTSDEYAFNMEDNNYELELPYLPLKLEVAKDYFEERFEIDDSDKSLGFSRDSLILKYKKESNPEWKIRIGDTGMTYTGSFTNFYKNVLDTNTKENTDSEKDIVQLYRYFDSQHPDEKICLSYASDYYRTFFVLSGSRIYYIDSFLEDETELDDNTLINQIAPEMVYIASSIRPSQTEKPGSYSYKQYIKQFAETVNAIKNDENQYNYDNAVKTLLERNPVSNSKRRSAEEKLLISRNLVKQREEEIFITDDSYLDYFTQKLLSMRLDNDSDTPEKRKALLNIVTKMDSMIQQRYMTSDSLISKNLLQSYYLAWLLQNYELPENEKNRYVNILTNNYALLYRPALFFINDNTRNEYFYKLFANRIFYSRRYFDTALKPEDILPSEEYRNNKFAFLGFEPEERPDAALIYNNIVRMNRNNYVRGKFILVYKEIEFALGEDFKASDVHALVLDEATLRFFPTVGKGFNKNKALKWIQSIYKDDYPPYLYYGDYDNLKIEQNGLAINGNSLGTKRLTRKGRQKYRKSNDFSELSELLNILRDIQRAYYQEDVNYYFTSLTSALEDEINHYVFDKTFRPSPRLTLYTSTDNQLRYNKNY